MKKDIKPKNHNFKAHGLWIYYLSNGNICYKGQYVNNIRYGYWMDNWDNLNDKYKIYFYLN